MAKFFHIQDVGAAPCADPDNATAPRQLYLKSDFIDGGTDPTRDAQTSQFLRPGFIDARYNDPFSKRETQSQISATRVRLLPLRPVQGLRPNWYDGTMSLRVDVHTGFAAESDDEPEDFVDSGKTVVVPSLEGFSHPQISRKAAHPPHTRHHSTLATLTRQYLILLRVLLAEYRSTWFIHVLGGLLIPISFAFVIVSVGGASSSGKALYLLGGNMAMSIATGPAAFLIGKMGWARQTKEFDYWIALPVSKLLLVFAIISVALVFALPGILGIYVLGSLLLGLPFSGTWALIPLIPLAVLPLTGVGALLGIAAPNGQTANVFSNILILFVGVLSPVMLPFESLPVLLRIIAQFMPTTYVADAFRAALGGQGTNLAFDLIILSLFSAVILTIMYFRLDWRNA